MSKELCLLGLLSGRVAEAAERISHVPRPSCGSGSVVLGDLRHQGLILAQQYTSLFHPKIDGTSRYSMSCHVKMPNRYCAFFWDGPGEPGPAPGDGLGAGHGGEPGAGLRGRGHGRWIEETNLFLVCT